MTTKIIITPAGPGSTKGAGTPRTVRVVTVGAPPAAGRTSQTKTVMTVPLPAQPLAGRGQVRTVLKRVYSSSVAAESSAGLTVMAAAPRKRQRLDHLTADQKNQRRKLKNRVAAQTARDRKKIQMDLLESRVTSLERQNDELLQQNTFLQKQNELLSQQNALLLQRLEPAAAAAAADGVAAASPASVESAAGTGVGGGGQQPSAVGRGRPDGAQSAQLGQLPGGSGDDSSQHADLLELLSQTIFGGEEETPLGGPPAAVAAVVGTAAEELGTSDDTLSEDPAEALLALLQPESPTPSDGAVPDSPRLSPEPSLPDSMDHLELELDIKPDLSDLCGAKTEHSLSNWSVFGEEPLDDHLDDQFLLFPQLVL